MAVEKTVAAHLTSTMHTKMNEACENIICRNFCYEDSYYAIFFSNVTVKRVFFCLGREKVVIISGM